ncbi:hypothetical protein EVAR_60859_1 [Eumeta japonica]|uniref:Uncharacterized protein n=1 Tax=Eumeta variegata TaxID=151549 RepID=A0A4C1Y7H2_EUMVA|nr:hypothetical protein EVAR_60859_1 [Eumeta japonica]
MLGGWKRRFVKESPSHPKTIWIQSHKMKLVNILKHSKLEKPLAGIPTAVKHSNAFLHHFVALFVAICNACIRDCYFPALWKEAVFIGISKPGKPRDFPATYKPISLSSVLVSTVSYKPPPPQYFCRRPRNVLIDPPDDLTAEVEKFIEGSHAPTASPCRYSRVSDEGVKAPGYRHRSHKLFRWFLVRESRAHLCARAHGRLIMGFSPPSPSLFARGELQKKAFSARPSTREELRTVVWEVQ